MRLINIIRIFLFSILFSCISKGNKTIYEFNGEKVIRIDTNGKSTFFYNNEELCAKYSGINDGFNAYLIFHPNNKVQILVGDGYFVKEKENNNFNFEYNIFYVQRKPNVYQIEFPQEYEIENNKSFDTQVKVSYLNN